MTDDELREAMEASAPRPKHNPQWTRYPPRPPRINHAEIVRMKADGLTTAKIAHRTKYKIETVQAILRQHRLRQEQPK